MTDGCFLTIIQIGIAFRKTLERLLDLAQMIHSMSFAIHAEITILLLKFTVDKNGTSMLQLTASRILDLAIKTLYSEELKQTFWMLLILIPIIVLQIIGMTLVGMKNS